jgi:hypothetical protein
MSHIVTRRSAGMAALALVIAGSTALATAANAETLTPREKAIVKHVKAECKDKAAKEAKGLGFVERWRSYSDCIHEAAKQNNGIDFSDID